MNVFFSLLKNSVLFALIFCITLIINIIVSIFFLDYSKNWNSNEDLDYISQEKTIWIEFHFANASADIMEVEFICDRDTIFIETIDAYSQKSIGKYVPKKYSECTVKYSIGENTKGNISKEIKLYLFDNIFFLANSENKFIMQELSSRWSIN